MVLFYHSVTEKHVVGIARVAKEAYPDPTATEGDWASVDLVPVRTLKKPVGLELIKTDSALRNMPLIKQTRLSVVPVNEAQFQRVLKLANTSLP